MRGFGFEFASQRGSHTKMARIGPSGQREILTIPNHRDLDTGTCRAILRQTSRYVPLSDLTPHFYSE